jgi:hypothetical protein
MRTLTTLALLLTIAAPVSARLSCPEVRALATGACERHSPYISVAEQVQLALPGELVTNEVVIRNADSCTCERACFQLTSGWHPPNLDPRPAGSVSITSTKLCNADGQAMGYVCLEPGEEARAVLGITVSETHEGAGYVTPVVFARRYDQPCYNFETRGWGPGCFEREGGALCVDMDYFECREFVYPAGSGS